MTSPSLISPNRTKPLSLQRRMRRARALRTSPFSVPVLLLLVYTALMIGLTQVADSWIVALAITPLVFALLISWAACSPTGRTSTRELPGLASLLLPIDAFDTSTHQVMGRRVAGTASPRMTASTQPGDQLSLFTGSREALPALQALLQPALVQGAQIQLRADLDPAIIARSGCLHIPIQDYTSGAGCGPTAPRAASRSPGSPIPFAPIG